MADALFHGELVNANRMLYTPSEFAKQNLLYIQEIGELAAQKSHKSQRENLASYLFFIVESGHGTLQYDANLYNLAAGDCVFIDCHKPYYHESSHDLWRLRWVHFNGSTMPGIEEKYRERGGQPVLHPTQLHDFNLAWEQLFSTAQSRDHVRDMELNAELAQLMTLLLAESWHPEQRQAASKRESLDDLRTYLDEHYPERITLDQLAAKFFINKYYLTRIFKDTYGQSINQYLQEVRITHAKQLLRFTKKPIETIGLECGFKSAEYFARVFKQTEGISGRAYRKMW
ncbi:AraC family transcriptional regulator [Lacticaseibacillus paracasei]|uniref:AraC family transcriptional regulator n=1 Tax=Lacticaseibacillus paracasei TaxID=1597 RepID=UPI0037DFC2FB